MSEVDPLCQDCILHRSPATSTIDAEYLEAWRINPDKFEEDHERVQALPNAEEWTQALRLHRPERCRMLRRLSRQSSLLPESHETAHHKPNDHCGEMAAIILFSMLFESPEE